VRQVHTLTGHSGVVTSVDFSSNGKQIVSGSADNLLKISRGRSVFPKEACLSQGGCVCPEAGLSVPRRTCRPEAGLSHGSRGGGLRARRAVQGYLAESAPP